MPSVLEQEKGTEKRHSLHKDEKRMLLQNIVIPDPPSLYEAGKLTLSPAALYSGSMWLKFLPCCVCMDLAAPPEYSNNALGSPGQTNLEPILKTVQSLTYLPFPGSYSFIF